MIGINPFITIYLVILFAVLGLVFGSFLNCTAIRLCNGESIAEKHSHCMKCGHELSAKDLVPVFSYLVLKGRCRYCGEKISPRYLISELASMIVFESALLKFDISIELAEYLILACLLLCISFADLEDFIIPDILIILGIVNRLVFALISGDILNQLISMLIGGFSISLPLLLVVLVAEKIMGREAMGGGDIKLLFMLGIYSTWQVNLLGLILSCFAGLIFAFISKTKKGIEFPFGPSIAAGYWISILFGEKIIESYLSLF